MLYMSPLSLSLSSYHLVRLVFGSLFALYMTSLGTTHNRAVRPPPKPPWLLRTSSAVLSPSFTSRGLLFYLFHTHWNMPLKNRKRRGGKERTRGIHLLFSLTYTRWPGIFTALGKIGTRRGDMLERERKLRNTPLTRLKANNISIRLYFFNISFRPKGEARKKRCFETLEVPTSGLPFFFLSFYFYYYYVHYHVSLINFWSLENAESSLFFQLQNEANRKRGEREWWNIEKGKALLA